MEELNSTSEQPATESMQESHVSPFDQASQRMEQDLSKPSTQQPEAPTPQSLTELEKLEKFMFKGKEMTLKDLESKMMMQEDYTRKTQSLAKERKSFEEAMKLQDYVNNWEVDLDKVRENPALAEQFMQIYPQSFHKLLRLAGISAEPQSAHVNPEISSLKSEIQTLREFQQQYQKDREEQQMKTLEAQFTNIYGSDIKSKYPFVLEDRLAGLVREAAQMGHQVVREDGNLDPGAIEKIAKWEHDRLQQLFQEHQKQTIDKQRAASAKARDIGPGGGIAGQAPKKLTFDQATAAAIREVESLG